MVKRLRRGQVDEVGWGGWVGDVGLDSQHHQQHHQQQQRMLVFSRGYCAALPCLTLIIPVWAVQHSGRMCSSLRNSLLL